MKAIAVIPARLASTRLPQKMLRQIDGKTLIARVYEGVRSSPLLHDVIVATDSDEIMQLCRQHDWNARMTSATHRSGTERVREISDSVEADIYVNVQGDEPLTRAEHLRKKYVEKNMLIMAARAHWFEHADAGPAQKE